MKQVFKNMSKAIIKDMQSKSIEEIAEYLRNSEYCYDFDFSEATEEEYRFEYCMVKALEGKI